MNYAIQPGLYALGDPNPNSVVLVTANSKLSFDHLRAHLQGRDVWILVLDTWASICKEMRIAEPAQIAAGLSGIILWITSQLIV